MTFVAGPRSMPSIRLGLIVRLGSTVLVLEVASFKERMLSDVFGWPAEIESDFRATPAAGRKHFILEAGHLMPVDLAGVVNRSIDSGLSNRFAWFKLGRHFETPFNSSRVLFSNETLLEQSY